MMASSVRILSRDRCLLHQQLTTRPSAACRVVSARRCFRIPCSAGTVDLISPADDEIQDAQKDVPSYVDEAPTSAAKIVHDVGVGNTPRSSDNGTRPSSMSGEPAGSRGNWQATPGREPAATGRIASPGSIYVSPKGQPEKLASIVRTNMEKGQTLKLYMSGPASCTAAIQGIVDANASLQGEGKAMMTLGFTPVANKGCRNAVFTQGLRSEAAFLLVRSYASSAVAAGRESGGPVVKVGKMTRPEDLTKRIVQVLTFQSESLTLAMVGDSPCEVAILALIEAKAGFSDFAIEVTPEVQSVIREGGGTPLRAFNLLVSKGAPTPWSQAKSSEIKSANPAVSSTGEPMITVTVKEYNALKAQVTELAQQNIDLVKVLTQKLMA